MHSKRAYKIDTEKIKEQEKEHQIHLQKQEERYESKNHMLNQKIEEQQKQHETTIHMLNQKIKEQKEQIEKLEFQNIEYHNQIFEIAKKPQQVTNNNNIQTTNSQTTTNNRILHITNHLIPIETDEEIRKMIDNQYTRDIFLGGSESLKDMTVSILKDQETGKYRTVCSDASRSVFYYLDNENNLIKDIGLKNIHKKFQKPLFAATSLHYKEIDQEGSIDDDKLCEIFSDNINFIDHELPNQLKSELQLPINLQE
jgi:uncharacterized protein YlzI (FlbEa/FlbD family)